MRFIPLVLCPVVLVASCAAVGSEAQPKSGATRCSVTMLVGLRFLDEDDWAPVVEPTVFGIEFDSSGPFDPVGFDVGFSFAEDSGCEGPIDLDTQTWEIYAGPRKTFSLANDHLHPYLSAGASWSNAEVDAGLGGLSADLDDDAFGFYLRAGVYYTFGESFNLGVDYRKLLGADYKDEGLSADGDFDQFSLSIGYSF
jgi:opacity protein-like surface antigen